MSTIGEVMSGSTRSGDARLARRSAERLDARVALGQALHLEQAVSLGGRGCDGLRERGARRVRAAGTTQLSMLAIDSSRPPAGTGAAARRARYRPRPCRRAAPARRRSPPTTPSTRRVRLNGVGSERGECVPGGTDRVERRQVLQPPDLRPRPRIVSTHYAVLSGSSTREDLDAQRAALAHHESPRVGLPISSASIRRWTSFTSVHGLAAERHDQVLGRAGPRGRPGCPA